ncbi:abscission/NoCut checkpoint regulator isoform X2 [Thrips palmi]|uniref:Abscission/NoCut checkpoint regulator isoform X2 n=1 Tax=Thrips palmi TaxID=161013 RepID=A0A6P8ZXN8_THRPL|nr:abscission/NoCut checkpoint regulator isoform X2 [Thrips palmi]
MPCHGCATSFGLWTKDVGCVSCGFSFCNSCLKQKCAVPKLNGKVSKVCQQCFSTLSSSESSTDSKMSQHEGPPDIFLKRLDALDGQFKPPVTMYRAEPRMQKLLKGLNSIDLDIVRRLEKLREDRRTSENVPSDDELARRLAMLKGVDLDDHTPKKTSTHQAPDNRSAEQQSNDLFSQCKEEVEIDSKIPNPDDEIRERLNRLRGQIDVPAQVSSTEGSEKVVTLDEIAQILSQVKMEASEKGTQPDFATIVSLETLRAQVVKETDKIGEESDSDEEAAAAKIISKVQAQVDLEKSCGIEVSDEEEAMDAENDEELPWCIICNEDAKIRCLGCDRDLYCKSCFQEGHMDEDMKCHSFEPYKK